MKNITREVMLQFEQARTGGECNMYDWPCVQRYANENELHDLALLTSVEYENIISEYSYLLEKFNLKQ